MTGKDLQNLKKIYEEHREFLVNEESIKTSLLLPFIEYLGFNTKNPREVRPEYAASFTRGDGKKNPDRMDYALFNDGNSDDPCIVIEAKAIGVDLKGRAKQLERYVAQIPNLHFGIMTDGIDYLFFSKLDNNQTLDAEPFFSFSLKDDKSDWDQIAKFLTKFSKEEFRSEKLIEDAMNNRYRQEMISKLSKALTAPLSDNGFLDWLTKDIYKRKRTIEVQNRLGKIAIEAVEPAMSIAMTKDFISKLSKRYDDVQLASQDFVEENDTKINTEENSISYDEKPNKNSKIETTENELKFKDKVIEILRKNNFDIDKIISRDTINYYNMSYQKPTRWFVRYFDSPKRKFMTTLLSSEKCKQLVPDCEAEDTTSFGESKIYITDIDQIENLGKLFIESLSIVINKYGN
jgi:predicted type IV restriction endonuclease